MNNKFIKILKFVLHPVILTLGGCLLFDPALVSYIGLFILSGFLYFDID
jgi:hypothetical protein